MSVEGRPGLTAFCGGTVWTGHGRGITDAVLVDAGRVVAVGENARSALWKCEEVVELDGGFLMPAFGDGHAHPMFAGLQERGPAVAGFGSVEAVVGSVGTWSREHPEAQWIVGGGYDPSIAADGALDARWLDGAVPDRPVLLRAADYHTVWCNSAALRVAGVDASTPEPRLGEILRRADGSPLGTLREWHAVDLLLRAAPAWSVADQVAALASAGIALARAGITWVQDAWVDPPMVEGYLAASQQGVLRVRTNLALRADPDSWHDQLSWFAAVRAEVAALKDPMLSARTVKFFADGVLEAGTAAMLEPYEDSGTRGMPVWDRGELMAAVTAVEAAGFQVHVHAIGDAAVRHALDAVEWSASSNGTRDARPVLTHVQVIHPDDLPRFAALGVIANVELLWAQSDPLQTVLTRPRLGSRRTLQQYPYASLLRSGARLSAGSDWPVSPHEPMKAIRVAVTRRTAEGEEEPWLPHERLDVEQALHACTAAVAHQAFAEDRRGWIGPGASADLVLLDDDPRRVEPQSLGDVAVRGTWLDGRRLV